ncbi:hypothetical protein HDU98_005597, partial [Podochytrium sp. JEL0797]
TCEYYNKALSETWSDSFMVVPEGVEIDTKRYKSLRAVLSHPDVKVETLHTILEFIYTGTAQVEDSLLSDVTMMADLLLLPSVKDQCLAHFAANALTPINAFEFYVLSDTIRNEKFKDEALLKAGSNLTEAVEWGRGALSKMGVEWES